MFYSIRLLQQHELPPFKIILEVVHCGRETFHISRNVTVDILLSLSWSKPEMSILTANPYTQPIKSTANKNRAELLSIKEMGTRRRRNRFMRLSSLLRRPGCR